MQDFNWVSLCFQGFELMLSELVQLANELCPPLLKSLVELIDFLVDVSLDGCFLIMYLH